MLNEQKVSRNCLKAFCDTMWKGEMSIREECIEHDEGYRRPLYRAAHEREDKNNCVGT